MATSNTAEPAVRSSPRRRFLRFGIAGAAILGIAGIGTGLFSPAEKSTSVIPESQRHVLRAVALAVLDGSLAPDATVREQQLTAQVIRLEAAIAAFPAATRTELSRLLAALAHPVGRFLVTGMRSDWAEADVATALQRMRHSNLSVRQQAYHALRDLTNAAFYSSPENWPLMGYPDPNAT